MEITGSKYRSWRPPDNSKVLSNSVERTGGNTMAPNAEDGRSLDTSKRWRSSFLECMDMQKVMDELANLERVCNSMIAGLPCSTNLLADWQDNRHTNKSEISTEIQPLPSGGLSQTPVISPVIVDLSSDDESNEDSEVVQGTKVDPGPSPSSQPSPFSNVRSNPLKRKADEESNVGQEDVEYEPHVFQVPEDLVQVDDNEVDEAIWNEREDVLDGAHKTKIKLAMGVGEISASKETKDGKKQKVTFMTDQIIVIDSDNEEDNATNCVVSTPGINDNVDIFVAKSSKLGHLIHKSPLVARKERKKLGMVSVEESVGRLREKGRKIGKVSVEDKAERLKEKERRKALTQERRQVRLSKKRGQEGSEEEKFSQKETDNQEFEEGDDRQEGDESPRKTSKKELEAEEQNRHIASTLHGEKIVYEPYVWRISLEDREEEDSELDDIWQDMATVVAVSSTTSAEPPSVLNLPVPEQKESDTGQDRKICNDGQHIRIDFDEDMGYYCEHCGAIQLDSPEGKIDLTDEEDGVKQKKVCEHKNRGYKDEVGQYCVDCGLVGRDIQKTFIPEVSFPTKTPTRPKSTDSGELDGKGTTSRVNLKVRDLDADDADDADAGDGEVELHLHPFYEEKLHPHQRDGFAFMTKNLLADKQGGSGGCILAHAPGTGKTFLIVSFIQSFLARFPQGRPIILAPKIMLKAWRDEFEKFKVEEIPIFELTGSNLVGVNYDEDDVDGESPDKVKCNLKENLTQKENRAKVLKEWQGSRGVLLMSYTLFSNLVENKKALLEPLEHQMSKVLLDAPGLVILDEGHLARTRTTKILKSLVQMRTKRKVLLSGTLFQNNFRELYTLLKLCREDFMTSRPEYARKLGELCGVSVGHSLRHRSTSLQQHEETLFTREFGDILENYVKEGLSHGQEIEEINRVVQNLLTLTAPFVHWYPGKILESLPGLTEFSVHLNLTDVQEKVILEIPPPKYHMSRHCRVLAACIHPSLVKYDQNIPDPELLLGCITSENLEQEVFQGVKIEFVVRMADLCRKASEKLLIFSTNLVPLSYIEKYFIKKHGWERGREFFRLDGTMAEHDRQSVITMFNNSKQPQGGVEAHVLMASTKACKEGITLVGASRVIILDTSDNPSVVRQAVSRAFRIGQKRKVYVYRLVTNSRDEEDLFRRSVNKEKLSKVLLDRVQTGAKIGEFLQELTLSEVKDELLSKLMQDDKGRTISVVNRYNASGC